MYLHRILSRALRPLLALTLFAGLAAPAAGARADTARRSSKR